MSFNMPIFQNQVPIKCCLALTASCVAGCERQTVEGYCRNNPKSFVCTGKRKLNQISYEMKWLYLYFLSNYL